MTPPQYPQQPDPRYWQQQPPYQQQPPPPPYQQPPYQQPPYQEPPQFQEPLYEEPQYEYPPQYQAYERPRYDPREFAQQPYQQEPPQPPQSQGVRARDLHNLPAIFILLLATGGIGYAGLFPEHWLRGVLFMAGALGLAGLFRLVLPARQAGWLAVRGRLVDVISYVGTGGALWVVGLLLPPTRT
jgi:hypothetical protein